MGDYSKKSGDKFIIYTFPKLYYNIFPYGIQYSLVKFVKFNQPQNSSIAHKYFYLHLVSLCYRLVTADYAFSYVRLHQCDVFLHSWHDLTSSRCFCAYNILPESVNPLRVQVLKDLKILYFKECNSPKPYIYWILTHDFLMDLQIQALDRHNTPMPCSEIAKWNFMIMSQNSSISAYIKNMIKRLQIFLHHHKVRIFRNYKYMPASRSYWQLLYLHGFLTDLEINFQ